MNRSQAIPYTKKHSRLAAVAGLVLPTDSTEGDYGLALDQALRSLGVSEDELPTAEVIGTENVQAFLALLDYYVLDMIKAGLGDQTNISTNAPGSSDSRNQMFTNADNLLKAAQAKVDKLGLDISEWNLGEIFLGGYGRRGATEFGTR